MFFYGVICHQKAIGRSENGIFFTAMAVTQGMPLIIEIGVILDVILAALVMTIMVLRVRSTVDADIADLDRLRG